MKKILFLFAIILLSISFSTAQNQTSGIRKMMLSEQNQTAPYQHSIGGVLGLTNGVSYKWFPLANFALQADAGAGYTYPYPTFKVNINLMYEQYIKKGFYWFAGAGVSVGNSLIVDYYGLSVLFGVNAIGGAEYKFAKIPLTLQADLRPGFALFFQQATVDRVAFDFSLLSLSARYTF